MQRRIADIEVLRGISIAFVVLHHFKTVLIQNYSTKLNFLFSFFDFWIGVDIFFAVSGFVVARTLLPQLNKSAAAKQFFIDTLSFWIKRAFRLWPAAWLWLMVILAAVLFFNRSGSFGTLEANAEATVVAILQIANFRFADFLIQHFEYGASFVYWSLSQEEQFYLLLPVAVFVLRRRLAAVLIAVLLIKAALALLFPEIKSTLLLMLLRADALLLGVLLAIWSGQPGYRLFEPSVFANRIARWALLSILFGCLCLLACDRLHVVPSPFRFSLIGVVATLPVLIASYDRNYIAAPGWLQSLLMWLGSRSYGIYLIHVPAFLLTKEIWFRLMPVGTVFDGAFNLRFAATAAILIIALGELNYRLVEDPLRRRGAVLADRFRANHSI